MAGRKRLPRIMAVTLAAGCMLTACGKTGNTGQESILTGEDLGVYYTVEDQKMIAVDCGGTKLEEYLFNDSGELTKDGETVLASGYVEPYVEVGSVSSSITDRTIELKDSSMPVKVTGTLTVSPVNATEHLFFAQLDDKKVATFSNEKISENITTNTVGDAEITIEFHSAGTVELTLCDASSGKAVYSQSFTVTEARAATTAVPVVSAAPATPTAASTPAASAAPVTPSPTPVIVRKAPVITRNPETAKATAGKSAVFTAVATDSDKTQWYAKSANGTTIEAEDLKDYFKTMGVTISDTTLLLENVPMEISGWRIFCTFTNSGGAVTTSEAVLYVGLAPTPVPNVEVHADTGNMIAAHTHSYTTEVVDPTETEGGYTIHRCSCGAYYITDETPALGPSVAHVHTYIEDDSTPGEITYICTECGYSYTEYEG